MGNRGNSRANTCIHTRLRKRVVFTSYRTNPGSAWPCGVILELIHAPIPDSDEGMSLVVTEPTQALPGLVVFHNNQTNRTASVGDVSSFKFQRESEQARERERELHG